MARQLWFGRRFLGWQDEADAEQASEEEGEEYDVDDEEWDEAARLSSDFGHRDPSRSEARTLCPECGQPLRHEVELCCRTRCCLVGQLQECYLCESNISAGELYFVCGECDLAICRNCGPGVCIERVFDFVDVSSGQRTLQATPPHLLHQRHGKVIMRKSVRRVRGEAERLAELVAHKMRSMVAAVAQEDEDIFDSEWEFPNGSLSTLFEHEGSTASSTLRGLAMECQRVFAGQDMLVKSKVPCKIFGDTHGQLRDVLLLFHHFGSPDTDDIDFVFNGDFVDRGSHQLELVGILFALKLLFPDRVWLVRGNHEDKHMNDKYGFTEACLSEFGSTEGKELFDLIQLAFSHMPMACLVGERVLVVHGGIGDGKWDLSSLQQVRRPVTHADLVAPGNEFLWNLLWSDPIAEDRSRTGVFGVHNSPRSKTAKTFGWDVTTKFCKRNNIDLVVRSHQAKKGGFGFDVMHDDSLIRVFSARDYEKNGNDGAVLFLMPEDREKEEGDASVIVLRPQVLRSLTKTRRA